MFDIVIKFPTRYLLFNVFWLEKKKRYSAMFRDPFAKNDKTTLPVRVWFVLYDCRRCLDISRESTEKRIFKRTVLYPCLYEIISLWTKHMLLLLMYKKYKHSEYRTDAC